MERICEKNSCGGVGEIYLEPFLGPAERGPGCGLFARVTIPPGSSCGYHRHEGDAETYVILSGEAEYNDNGAVRTVRAGDVTYTPDGASHGMDNTRGSEPLVFIALILKTPASR